MSAKSGNAKSHVATNIVVQLESESEHVLFSELEKNLICPEEVDWRVLEHQDIELFVEEVLALLERKLPQRITLPAFQAFVGVVPVQEVINAMDGLLESVRGSRHLISIPTMRYVPSAFPSWEDVTKINKFIWQKAVEMAAPILLLHKSFLSRQNGAWVVCPSVYTEFVSNDGLGSELTKNGKYRYAARLLRYHGSFKSAEPPCQLSEPVVPLPLWNTWAYIENECTWELLNGLGYNMDKRLTSKRKGGKPRGKVNKRQKAGADDGVAVVGEKEKAAAAVNGGRAKNVVTYSAPISVISIDSDTFKRVFRENMELRADLKALKESLDDSEAHNRRQGEKLKVAEAERARYKHESRASSKRLRKLDEESYKDLEEWRVERDGLLKDISDLEWEVEDLSKDNKEYREKLAREKDRYTVLEAQLHVWEMWVNSERKKDEEKRKEEKKTKEKK